MFEQNYKNAMDKITPDADVRDKILDKIVLKEELKDRRNPAIPWRIAFACVACVAIILGVVFVPRDSFKTASSNSPKTLTVSKSYNEIYKLIKPKNDVSFWDYVTGIEAYDQEVYEMEYVTEEITFSDSDGAPSSTTAGTSSQNMNSAQNGAQNQETDPTATDFSDDYSTTTEQVEGVREADIVKTDGEYIYYLNDTHLSIFKANGEASSLVSQTKLSDTMANDLYGEMFIEDDRLILLKTNYYKDDESFVLITIYDISDPAAPKKVAESCQEGRYNSSRMVGDYVYLVSNSYINISKIDKDDPTTFVPVTETNGVCEAVPADSIYRYNQEEYTNQYTVIGAFNYKDGTLSDTASLLGGTDNIYCSEGNIILADTNYNSYDSSQEGSYPQNSTIVSRLEIKKGKIEYKTTGEVDGTLENQFFIDEHNGYFRFVTTVSMVELQKRSFDNAEDMVIEYSTNNTTARLTVLNSDLEKVGEIKDLAKGERVYSVRFMGDTAYFVTFRQTDPLFSADLSDPKNPKILGELKIPGFSEYMYPYGDGLLLGFGMDADENTGRTKDLKLSMFDITDPANVTEDDKTVIDGYAYSPALSNHKAMLVSSDKNLIGFAATDSYDNVRYLIYRYTGDGFERVATLTVKEGYNYYAMSDVRGLFISDNFYVVSESVLQVYDINTFLQINRIDF